MPRFGIVAVQDSESRRKRLVDCFQKNAMRALFIEDTFDAERITEYFFQADQANYKVKP